MGPPTLAEYSLAAWIVSIYVFGASFDRVWISNCAAAFMVGAAILHIARSNSFGLNSAILSRVVFAFYCGVTTVAGAPTTSSALTVAQIVLVMAAAANIIRAARSIRCMEFGCYAGSFILLVNSYIETGLVSYSTRYGNLLGNANSYAFALLIGCIFGIRRLLVRNDRRISLLSQAFLMLLLTASGQQILVASGSRKGILVLMLVAAFGIIGSWALHGLKHGLRVGAPMVFVVAGVIVVGAATPHASRLHSLIELISGTKVQESSAAERRDMAVEAWDLWRERPFWGWGFDQYRNVSSQGDYSHSNISELLVNGGIAAVALYYVAFWFVAMDIRRQWLQTRSRQNRIDLAWAALVAVVLCIWSVAAVQYEQKLDAIVLAVTSLVPAIVKQGPAREGDRLLVFSPALTGKSSV